MVKLFSTIKIAFRGLVRQKMRTFLTSFAVFIGVFLIITMVSGTTGGEQLLTEQFTSAFDLKNIIVGPKGSLNFNFAAPSVEETEVKPVTDEVVNDLLKDPDVERIQPIVQLSGKTLKVEGQEKPVKNIFGSGFDLSSSDKYIQEILAGEVKQLSKDEALVSNKISEAYKVDPSELIGKKITLEDDTSSFFSTKVKDRGEAYTFTIVGVIDVGRDQNNFVTSVEKSVEMQAKKGGFKDSNEYLKEIGYDQLYLTARSEGVTKELAKRISEKGFDATTVEQILDIFSTITTIVKVVFSMFGIIALAVASVGIINTMIMSVYERTKEIGVMKAIGASRGDIRSIFLSEAAMIGFTGGVMGLVTSLIFMALLEKLLINNIFPAQNIEINNVFTTPAWLMYIPVIFATIIGVIAGVYPAIRASRLSPVDALRYE